MGFKLCKDDWGKIGKISPWMFFENILIRAGINMTAREKVIPPALLLKIKVAATVNKQ